MSKHPSPHSGRFIKAAALTLTALATPSYADGLRPPTLPTGSPLIVTSTEGSLFRIGHAVGTQQYVCTSSVDLISNNTKYEWKLYGPQATLFKDVDLTEQSMTHFQSSNPLEIDPSGLSVDGLPRPTWQDSSDTSSIWAQPTVPRASAAGPACDDDNNPSTPPISSIALLKLGVGTNPSGHMGKLSATTFVQRLNTCGGVAPVTGCSATGDIGRKALVPYTASYYFYR